MDGVRTFGSARCNICICKALPEHMHSRTREIVSLETDQSARGKGHARELMEAVTAEADAAGLALILIPRAFGESAGLTTEQLVKWYQRRFNFVPIQLSPMILARWAKP